MVLTVISLFQKSVMLLNLKRSKGPKLLYAVNTENMTFKYYRRVYVCRTANKVRKKNTKHKLLFANGEQTWIEENKTQANT